MFDAISVLIGVFIGFIIALIFGWLSYKTNVFIFTYCANDVVPHCHHTDYYEDPGQQLKYGGDIDNMLFLNDKNVMYWHRGTEKLCVPGRKQDIAINYPQYCSFTDDSGNQIEARNISYESPNYISTSLYDGKEVDIIARPNCQPQSFSDNSPYILTGGIPLLKWDESI